MFEAIGRVVAAIANAVYTLVAAVTSWFGGAPRAHGWEWEQKVDVEEQLSDVHDIIKKFMQDQGIKAAQCAIRIGGALKLNAGYTWAEPEYGRTEHSSVMRIASCSKNFTTAAILKLISQSKVKPDDEVFELLGITEDILAGPLIKEPPDARVKEITVKDLIEHKGGWDYDAERTPLDPVFSLRKICGDMHLDDPPTKKQFAQYMFHQKLDFPPGDTYSYSNVGYLLLGMVVDSASGKSYMDYLNDEILNAHSISDVFVGKTRLSGRRDNEVVYEDPFRGPDATDPRELMPAPMPYGGSGAMTELMDSGGGLITSARSLSLFIRNHNIWVDADNNTDARRETRRDGNMPGSNAVSECFSFKDKGNNNIEVDYAMIFNRFRVANKIGGTVNIQFEELVTKVTDKIKEKYS